MKKATTPKLERLLTKKEVVELTGASLSTVDRLIKDGELPTVKLGKTARAVRIKESDFLDFLDRNSSTKKAA